MSSEILRRAASLIRERAEAAKAGTPGGMGIAIKWSGLRSLAGRGLNEAEAEYLATWSDPAVALAVADWLENVARNVVLCSEALDESFVSDAWVTSWDDALNVARAYLGEAS